MSEYEVRVRFDANAAKRDIEKKLDGKVGALTKDPVLYKALLEAYFNAKSPHILNVVKDSGAFGLGNKAAGGVTSRRNKKFERFGEVRYTTKGLIIDPISVYTPTGNSTRYAEAVFRKYPYELDLLMYYPGSPGWDDFIKVATKIVKERAKKDG